MRAFARTRRVRNLARDRDVDGLVAALAEPDPILRRLVAIELKELGDASAVPALIEAVVATPPDDAEDIDVDRSRSKAVEALGEIGDPRGVEAVRFAVDAPQKYLPRRAVIAAGGIQSPETIALLRDVLLDPARDWWLRDGAARSLGRLGARDVLEEAEVFRDSLDMAAPQVKKELERLNAAGS